MTSREIRRSFLAYFEKHGHRIVPSSSLVPADDPTLLFTNAGMNQFKDVFLGRERRDYRRATSSQKCMRVSGKHNDLDNVGPSLRHHTFFEMLGNFSFGDYFKEEAIQFSWTMLTEVWNLPPDKLSATIFAGDANVPRDEEAYRVWRQYLPAERIQELGGDDNFWQMANTGPCGRCSEIYVDRSDDPRCPESDRLLEVWNNVFMEFDRQPDGTLVPLPAPSIDTGMSLERITGVIQGTFSNYDTDLFTPILAAIEELARVRHGEAQATDISMHVIADHVRATTFLIADGVVPSNEWRGYVLRKIMRRAMRHGKRLGIEEPFLHRLVDVVVALMGTAYPELPANRDTVVQIVRGEEDRFDSVLTGGLPRLEQLLERVGASASRTVPGDEAFRLYDSLGMPVDFIEDLASERQLTFDRTGFDRAMEAQRERARASSAFEHKKGTTFTFESDDRQQAIEHAGDRFEGYAATALEDVPILAVFDEQRGQVEQLDEGALGFVVTERTPFYHEAGGQVSDTGTITASGDAPGPAAADVIGLVRIGPGAPRAHRVRVLTGSLAEGDRVALVVDRARRDAIRRNHTATHLLHAALRRVLGSHVKQAGSLVAPDRLRFDFVHPAAISRADLDAIERLVNEQIMRNVTVQTTVQSTAEAMAAGATALFGEKYGDRVRVVGIPDFSLELCGGTHCAATGDIGYFTLVSEGAIAAGVRRIEALTGEGALAHVQASRDRFTRVLDELKVAPDQAAEAVARLQTDVKRLSRELQQARLKAALGQAATPGADGGQRDAHAGTAEDVAGVRLIVRRVDELDRSALRHLADQLKGGLGSGVVILATAHEGKVAFVVSVTRDLASRLRAGAIVKELAPIVGGGGGGRPDFAEAGGRDPGKIDALLEESRHVVERMAALS
ncbi:MAG: alanine--tRNA ligase [Luteitalea sp.]|nr:alanine--tRNA ligase [Luteitalea sp.]